MTAVFPKKSDLPSEEVCDTLRTEWRLYQTESIPETAYRPTVEPKVSSRRQSSYWKKAFHLADLGNATKDPPTCDMEKFALYLQKLNSSDVQPKYPFLISLFKALALLSVFHGNSAPENGFSINKAMLNVHGYSLGESTVEALQFVKDTILQHSSILDLPVARSLFEVVKDSRKRYIADLEAMKSIERKEEAKKKELEPKIRTKP